MTESLEQDIPRRQAVTPDGAQEPGNDIFAERARIARLSRVRELVFGSLDGLLVPLGVVSGVAGGTMHSQVVIIAGLAEAFAGALSMGAGEFISGRAEAQVHQTEIQKERAEIEQNPRFERAEMALLLQREGIAPVDANHIADILERYPRAYENTMIEKELGLQADVDLVRIPEALTIGISYVIGSIFPLIAYFFFPVPTALPISIVLTIVALIIVGIIKGKLASLNMARSIAEVVIVGGASALGGYLLGTIVPRLFGF
ncbi:MAG TPA: VIT1/CCC1 transporter family protein [Ktedonobacterales bacterium]|nr:VIT1/CCC1 transporter family protein [Ktedonobacterales bacterium]